MERSSKPRGVWRKSTPSGGKGLFESSEVGLGLAVFKEQQRKAKVAGTEGAKGRAVEVAQKRC